MSAIAIRFSRIPIGVGVRGCRVWPGPPPTIVKPVIPDPKVFVSRQSCHSCIFLARIHLYKAATGKVAPTVFLRSIKYLEGLHHNMASLREVKHVFRATWI